MNELLTFYSVDSLQSYLISSRDDQTVGLVPTMGALHHGHVSLVEKALKMNDIVVVSIFVNPTQFNNPKDLEKYPRPLEADIALLAKAGNVIVFVPSVDDVYPKDHIPAKVELGGIATSMEGEFRPGHFDGVINVVKRLFDIIIPDTAYFGLKDYQQLAVIQKMVKDLALNVNIVPCEIIRETSGLASSSRNMRLSEGQKEEATIIFKVLSEARKMSLKNSVEEVKEFVTEQFKNSPLELEYFDIVDPDNLADIQDWSNGAQACLAAICGEVRLIDNMRLR